MSDDKRPAAGLEPDDDVEAQLLKESLGAGLAAAAIFAGSSQAASYPVPSPPGAADATEELALIPSSGELARAIQQASPQAEPSTKAGKAKKLSKAKKSWAKGASRGGRAQPQVKERARGGPAHVPGAFWWVSRAGARSAPRSERWSPGQQPELLGCGVGQ
jgi:hypothetical protein